MSTDADHTGAGTGEMDRLTVRIPDRLLDELEVAVENGEYPNRSVAIRRALADELDIQRRAPR